MSFDGITTNCIMQELNHLLAGQRISKIAQPEREELLFTFKALNEGSNRLLISANASLPFLYMTKENKTSPLMRLILYAPSQIYRKRTHQCDQPAFYGTCALLYHRAFG